MIKQLSLAFAAVLLLASVPGEGASPCANPTYVQAWTPWFDRDNPSGTGDWETLSILKDEHPGKICDIPQEAEALTLSGQTVTQAGENIFVNDKTSGFACRNEDQPDNICFDYKVRFSCSPPLCSKVCWTKWYDRDNPSGTGDWETLTNLRDEFPGQICAVPLYIEAVTVVGETPAILTGNNIIMNKYPFSAIMMKQLSLAFAAVLLLASTGPSEGGQTAF
ncbi:cell migration-inducing and hyaluronan-binding protein [Austrofundulus limnaeus]|uniref:Cell migration-inducing and hyaluronan-binding protein n=1 Tax=Austrofundulus limnaeus TaxID=52670 RepID=A0A2I4AI60_AUSLI|nr:PREDICTED: cell migration-inducing and hyaluronan-binding protein-like [Austrofundulus limnaeus]